MLCHVGSGGYKTQPQNAAVLVGWVAEWFNALDYQAGYRGFESRQSRDNYQTTRRTLG